MISMIKETISANSTEKLKAHSCKEFLIRFKTARGLQRPFSTKHKCQHSVDYEVALPQNKLKDLFTLRREKLARDLEN